MCKPKCVLNFLAVSHLMRECERGGSVSERERENVRVCASLSLLLSMCVLVRERDRERKRDVIILGLLTPEQLSAKINLNLSFLPLREQ